MFLIRLSPSMREALGAGNHKTAAAMVNAADALWDAQGSDDPTVAAATTQQNRSPAPTSRKRGEKRAATPILKAAPLPAPISIPSTTLAMARSNVTIIMPTRLTSVSHPVIGQKTELQLNPFLFGGHSST
jgi:hypothetical protein